MKRRELLKNISLGALAMPFAPLLRSEATEQKYHGRLSGENIAPLPVVMGVSVGQGHLTYEIQHWDGIISGSIHGTEPKHFERLDGLMLRHNVKKCVINPFPHYIQSTNFAQRFPNSVILHEESKMHYPPFLTCNARGIPVVYAPTNKSESITYNQNLCNIARELIRRESCIAETC